MKYIIALDIGTSSMRSVIYSADGNAVSSSSWQYHTTFPQANYVEQDPTDWADAADDVLMRTAAFMQDNGITAEGIAVTSQRASLIPVDPEGMPLYNAIMWQDKRTLGECRALEEEYGLAYFYHKTGLRISPTFILPKLMWLKANHPEIFKNASRFIGVQDFVVHYLTGQFKTDWTQGSRTMLMDLREFSWDPELLKIAGCKEDRLCELVAPGNIAGGLKTEFANRTGLKSGLPVVISGGDQQNAALALGVVKPGMAEANTGTGSFVVSYSDKPIFDEDCRLLCQASAIKGKWVVEAGIYNTGALYRWFKEQFCPDLRDCESPYVLMDNEAQRSAVGSNGVIMLPHFGGSFAPNWNAMAKGIFFNLSLGVSRGDMIRSILEGIAMEISDNISLIRALTGKLESVSVAGGMVHSDLFCEIQASAYNLPVVRYKNSEATSLGACMVASPALGVHDTLEQAFDNMASKENKIFMPEPTYAQSYSRLAARRKRLYTALDDGGAYAASFEDL